MVMLFDDFLTTWIVRVVALFVWMTTRFGPSYVYFLVQYVILSFFSAGFCSILLILIDYACLNFFREIVQYDRVWSSCEPLRPSLVQASRIRLF